MASGPLHIQPKASATAHPIQDAVRFAADDALCVSAGYDRSVRVFDVRSNACDPIQTIAAFRDAVTSLAVSDTKIIAGSVDGTVRTFDVRAGRNRGARRHARAAVDQNRRRRAVARGRAEGDERGVVAEAESRERSQAHRLLLKRLGGFGDPRRAAVGERT